MGKKKKNSLNSKDLQRKSGVRSLRQEGLEKAKKIVFGLSMKDNNQGEDYENWEDNKLLAKTLRRLQALCSMTMEDAKNSK